MTQMIVKSKMCLRCTFRLVVRRKKNQWRILFVLLTYQSSRILLIIHAEIEAGDFQSIPLIWKISSLKFQCSRSSFFLFEWGTGANSMCWKRRNRKIDSQPEPQVKVKDQMIQEINGMKCCVCVYLSSRICLQTPMNKLDFNSPMTHFSL